MTASTSERLGATIGTLIGFGWVTCFVALALADLLPRGLKALGAGPALIHYSPWASISLGVLFGMLVMIRVIRTNKIAVSSPGSDGSLGS